MNFIDHLNLSCKIKDIKTSFLPLCLCSHLCNLQKSAIFQEMQFFPVTFIFTCFTTDFFFLPFVEAKMSNVSVFGNWDEHFPLQVVDALI